MQQLTFQYPSWYLVLCIFLGLVYAGVLYFRNPTFRDQSPWLSIGLGLLRFLAVALISILLLDPILRILQTDTKKPVVVIAQDVSESVGATLKGEARKQYETELNNLTETLQKDYEVATYSFGTEFREGLDTSFSDKSSNLSEALRGIYDLYSNQNLGAVILATDGIFNEGSNPIYTHSKLNAPVYTIALGDTIPKRDAILRRVFHNQIAYLGDQFVVQVDIGARNCAGANPVVTIYQVQADQVQSLQQIPLSIGTENFFQTVEFTLSATAAGVQRYRIQLSAVPGEASTANNVREFYIDVLDSRQKILLLANAPHPDLAALKQSILRNKNYSVDIAYLQDLKVKPEDYDLVVFHQLPSRTQDITRILDQLNRRKISRLFIGGTQTQYQRLNRDQSQLEVTTSGTSNNDVQALFNPGFSLFTVSEDLRKQLPQFAPLVAPFGDFKASPSSQILLFQRIGRVETQYPLLVLGEENGIKTGVLAAEGLWKWRLFDYMQHENHDLFDELTGKIIQYLSLKEDKRRFRITPSKTIFSETDAVVFDAELYNESFELVNDPDVLLTITDEENRQYNYTFDKSGKTYTLNAGILPPGSYRYRGQVNRNGEPLTFEGQFSVQPVQLELYETTANHGLLRLLSREYGGELRYADQLAQLPSELAQLSNLKPVIYQSTRTQTVLHFRWIFAVLAFLLFLEWFLRRYFGAY
ncbi:MAG: hypothetical protein H6563_13255 [Lewinellaceae bacterium]|nr:hypothetical protein [Lewinellaceae bacterium]